MAESNTNNQANVSAAKGVKGGYIFSAPVGTELPTDIKTKLGPAFKCLGFHGRIGPLQLLETFVCYHDPADFGRGVIC